MKLLIADDERETSGLLQKDISWEELGISEIQTAHTGQLALECAMKWRPDIILCDIRMLDQNGIAFARQYREIDPNFKLICLSCFTDKEYLKAAIHLKALTYIEKPVNLGEVRSAVETAVQLCLEDIKKKADEAQKQVELDRSLPFFRQEILRRMIINPTSPHVKLALRSHEKLFIPLDGPYTIAVANLYMIPAKGQEDISAVQERMLIAISHHPLLLELKILAGFDLSNQLVLIFPGTYGSAYRQGRETIEEVTSELRQIAGSSIELRLGIGDPVPMLFDLPTAYKQASQANAFHYYCKERRPVFSNSLLEHAPIEMNWEEVRSLRDLLRKGEILAAKQMIRQWATYARSRKDLDIYRVKDTFLQFLLAIIETADQLGLIKLSVDTEWRNLWKEIDRIPNLDALENYILIYLDSFSVGLDEGNASRIGKIRNAIRYIEAHFEEKELTIRMIADHVQLSESYLCVLFKKQCGQTIHAFIRERRMNKAKDLLLDLNLKQFEVAYQLGFTDANYFATYFKRYEGCTPSEFRGRALKVN